VGLMAALVGTAALLMMSVGGLLMLSSAGNETQYEKGKSMLKYSVIGLAFALGAYILVTSIQLLIKGIWS
ncbi:hypothetical protein JXA05_01530, partial [Candidatus Peregrinibacteria bacterium]|nr:hypothetical protein [Candidatus Peregrinibacteria bacterium]